jgi:3-deoxy-D-manno-octulosonate 8-phosphate phosphatase KdsC-like HAD superfamily phosphatase
MTPEIDQRARGLRLLLFDVDGVMTDGRILLHPRRTWTDRRSGVVHG